MKLKDEFIKYSKDGVYEMYESIVYEPKDYDDITRSKMLDEIILEYKQERFLYDICTERELKFLKYCKGKKLVAADLKKYEWEIKELNKKAIFSCNTFGVFEEFQSLVDEALKFYEKDKKSKSVNDQIAMFIIGMVRVNGEILVNALIQLLSSLLKNPDSDHIYSFFGHPLIHFYCDFYYEDFGKDEAEFIYYRGYFDLLDELENARYKYGIGGSKDVDIRDYIDIFYYGFPIRNEKVKKMYDMINKKVCRDFDFKVIDEARLLYDYNILRCFVEEENELNIICEALNETPSGAMNGFTPNEYLKEQETSKELNVKFDVIPQNDAHLCKRAADQYYKVYFALLEYTNLKNNIVPEQKKIYKQEGLDVYKLRPIDEYLWNNRDIIDEFIKENKYHFNEEELNIIKDFKTFARKDKFVIVGLDRDYTKMLSKDGKLYMVKGLRVNIDEIIDVNSLPLVIDTTLLPFKGNIVFNGFIITNNIKFGNDFNKAVLKDYENAITFYHL